ncbi:hypothetical protein GGR95_002145 [Sulfitobacter undariae]|uniref:Uncharacterized protein n=1 Tax=Sulfitobacter undariae TaxID=1563671 RepID=A0A7W6EB16_9RHOB|nr:hypothetical protein [Sulfitobacter undariae]MBB3994499.1 hypothetical protein [Sulfitobacter undariae]
MNTPHGAVLISVVALPVLFILLAVSFWLGRVFEANRYEDTCLDLGGGRNPGGYSICVISPDSQAPETQD